MPLDFPNTPGIGSQYSLGGKTWTYNGAAWDLTTSRVGYTGSAGSSSSYTESTYTSETSITPNLNTTNLITVTAQATSLVFNNPTGSPTQGQKLLIRIKDNGTARALSFGSNYRAGTDIILPTSTTASKTLYIGFVYNSTDSKLDLLAVLDNI